MTPTADWRARERRETLYQYVNQFTSDPAQPAPHVAVALKRVLYELDRVLAAWLLGAEIPHTVSYLAACAARDGEAWGIALCALLSAVDPGHCERVLTTESGTPSPPWVPT